MALKVVGVIISFALLIAVPKPQSGTGYLLIYFWILIDSMLILIEGPMFLIQLKDR